MTAFGFPVFQKDLRSLLKPLGAFLALQALYTGLQFGFIFGFEFIAEFVDLLFGLPDQRIRLVTSINFFAFLRIFLSVRFSIALHFLDFFLR